MKTNPASGSRRPLAIPFLFGMFLAAGCAQKGPDPDDLPVAPAGAGSRVAIEQGVPVVKLKPEEIGRIGLKTVILERSAHQPMRPAFGVVLDPQPLAISASSLAEARARMTKAETDLAVSAAEHDRAKHLHEDQGNLSTREFEAAEAAWRSDQAAAGAAQSALRSAKIAARQQWGAVLADWLGNGGVDYERVESGEAVLLRVAAPGDAPAQPPAFAEVSLPGGQWAKAAFVSAASQASPEFQSTGYFFVIKAGPGLLPGMNLNVLLPADGPGAESVDIPATAVLHWRGKTWVYLQSGPGTYSRREILTGKPDGEGGTLAADFPAGRPLVIQGAAALLSEEFKPAGGDSD